MAINYYQGLNLPEWELLPSAIMGTSQSLTLAVGTYISEDHRNNNYANPYFYFSQANSNLRAYNHKYGTWSQISTATGIGGTFGAGSCSVFVPSMSPVGTIAAGATTTTLTLTTALPASVFANQLADRGDGIGFIIRIIGNAGGSSGKTEERRVIANTSGTTPLIELDSALTFTPASGDRYEFLSGSYLQLNTGVLAANQFRKYDVLTGSFSSLATTSLIATVPATGNVLIAFDPSYVPNNRITGEGQVIGAGTYNDGDLGCLTATGSAAGTLTGEASVGDYGYPANTFRNYQIRIVEDTAIPTAVGQVRKISSHTFPGGGAGAVYTLASSWSVTPSTTCKFVIEHYGDNIMGLMGGTATVYNYSISGNTWSTATWATRTAITSQTTSAFAALTFGIVPNKIGTLKSSNVFCIRGNSHIVDVLDISGAATGSWTLSTTLIGFPTTASTFESFSFYDLTYYAYNPHSQNGVNIIGYLGASSTSGSIRPFALINTSNYKLSKFPGPRIVGGTSTHSGAKCAFVSLTYIGTDKVVSYSSVRAHGSIANPEYVRCLLHF